VPDPRPPLRSAQRRFWRVVRDGGSVEHAAAAAGVALRTGHTWFRNAGGMPPLPLDVPDRRRHLSLPEREEITAGLHRGQTATRIAADLGRATSTVTRDIKAHMRHRRSRKVGDAGRLHGIDWVNDWEYSPSRAQRAAEARLRRAKTARLAGNPRLREEVEARLRVNHSPEQIAARLEEDFPHDPEMRVSHETIYQALYVQARGGLKRELTRHLRTGRTLRKPQRRGDQRRERIKGMVPIAQRPAEVADRAVPGHWESQWGCQAASPLAGGVWLQVRLSRSRAHKTSVRRRASAMTAWLWVRPRARFFR
jgi:IS30 family transposase